MNRDELRSFDAGTVIEPESTIHPAEVYDAELHGPALARYTLNGLRWIMTASATFRERPIEK
jgi:hypothetical protein